MEDIVNKRKPQYGKVKKLVNKVLEDNCITNPPIDIKDLINNYGLKLKFARFPEEISGVCGFLDINEEAIYVNADNSLKRQNFTIAHELGHWLLHREEINKSPQSYKVLRRQPIGGEKDYRETEANTFAANLLVPTNMLKICKKASFSPEMMSDLFSVSSDVIGYRLKNEGLND